MTTWWNSRRIVDMATSEHATAASRRLPSCPPHPWIPSQDLRKVLGREARREPRSREIRASRTHVSISLSPGIMDHMDMDGGLGLERPDWTDWTGVPETCLACISPHTHHTAADARPKKKPWTRIREGVLRTGTRGRCLIRRVFRKLASPSCPDLEKSLPLPLRFPFPACIFCLLGLCLVFCSQNSFALIFSLNKP
ncbi:hypothetical protein BGZ61DRAFT_13756 [Ilyonectria robusta]|uniref:uncharacterized protein n=1 Tax=Ilyonectria robusta TaxID=1079257 RepID=UPI001E8D170D|nr:uncharacterized protein BGZ61DRAFT_13756 [Ilyonectria robusta]KAH8737339.1 hypothetical protein BGZ61DRAFT_13756 [Ilyonectria robusta]